MFAGRTTWAVALLGFTLPALLVTASSRAAFSASGGSAGSAFDAATIAPASGVTASPRLTCRIDVSWTATPTAWAAGHKVYRAAGGGTANLVATITPAGTTTYSDTDSALKGGLSYVYTVRAYSGAWLSAPASSGSVLGPAICGGG